MEDITFFMNFYHNDDTTFGLFNKKELAIAVRIKSETSI
ncbi:hypothetical protein J2S19_003291 [Metabacillus malikii]|uniref:Uncharacterized protein n=1 Tax=Metabacillus malikii TaxID=1504265 RepID=A0ABT9ZI99_9BACI|nr:hypothetical protein [Metabacillus malikii]